MQASELEVFCGKFAVFSDVMSCIFEVFSKSKSLTW